MIHQHELKANDVHAYTLEIPKEHLSIKADGYICNTEMILNVLIKASLPTHRHLSRELRTMPNASLQFLLEDTICSIRRELPPEPALRLFMLVYVFTKR
jgi:hypothetical protein